MVKRSLTLAAAGAVLAACAPTYYGGGYGAHTPRSGPPRATHDPSLGPAIVALDRSLQCVPYARALSGILIQGDAHTWWSQAEGRYPRGHAPAAGAVFVLRGYSDPTRGHVAVVTAVVSAREIRVDQANWLNQGEISVRVPVYDVSPGNDWSEVKVWHIPTNAWGARTYAAEGFIYPAPSA
jgi:hypothetical protein